MREGWNFPFWLSVWESEKISLPMSRAASFLICKRKKTDEQ